MKVALQLYTIREATSNDFLGACREVASMGYEWVELAGFGGMEPKALANELLPLGLNISGSHTGERAIRQTDETIRENLALGNSEVTVAWLPPSYRDSAESCRRTSRQLQGAAERFEAAGLTLGYHNHADEFAVFEDALALDLLFSNAPSLNAQIDVFWAAKGGQDPASVLLKFAGMAPSVHMKDLGADGADIELGDGILDWHGILRTCEEIGAQTLVLEMDNPRFAPLESARRCLEGLRKFL